MIILGIETSCDETAAAVLERKNGRIQILSNIVASSALLQAKYGGIIPEQAAREQLKSIIPVITEALLQSNLYPPAIDAIAVTYGPGLIGSLLVGTETAKTLATTWSKPLIPVNHLLGHFYANWISSNPPSFPCIGLLVSGGHTDLVLFKNHNKYEYLGGTRDDAAGECFDKCARLLGLSYPGGPEISKLATQGDALRFNLPRPMINSKDFDFSFSGLKTALVNVIKLSEGRDIVVSHSVSPKGVFEKPDGRPSKTIDNLCASVEAAIVDVLVTKTIAATRKYDVEQIMVAGGVAANQKLVDRLQVTGNSLKIKITIPPANLCTDNGAMIAAAAFFLKPIADPLNVQANPALSW